MSKAVIVGAGIAGLAAAAATAPFFEAVTIFDKDALPSRPLPRKGVAQDLQVHILLKGGELALEALMPGTRAALLVAGAVEVRQTEDVLIWERDEWHARRDLGHSQLMMSRPAYEHVLRRQVLTLGNVTIQDRTPIQALPSEAILPAPPNSTIGHATMRYVLEIPRSFDFFDRNGYSSIRSHFRPAASVVLPRKQSVSSGENVA